MVGTPVCFSVLLGTVRGSRKEQAQSALRCRVREDSLERALDGESEDQGLALLPHCSHSPHLFEPVSWCMKERRDDLHRL